MKKVQLFALATVATAATLGFASSALAGGPVQPPKSCAPKCGSVPGTVTVTGGAGAASADGKTGSAHTGNTVIVTGKNPSFSSNSSFTITGGNAKADTMGTGTAGKATATLKLGATANTTAGKAAVTKTTCNKCGGKKTTVITPATPGMAMGSATGTGTSTGKGIGAVTTYTSGNVAGTSAVSHSISVGTITVKVKK
jgi:hypothetical protein